MCPKFTTLTFFPLLEALQLQSSLVTSVCVSYTVLLRERDAAVAMLTPEKSALPMQLKESRLRLQQLQCFSPLALIYLSPHSAAQCLMRDGGEHRVDFLIKKNNHRAAKGGELQHRNNNGQRFIISIGQMFKIEQRLL